MSNRLYVTSITSIGAVETGDNPEADIMLWKRKPVEPEQGQTMKEGVVSESFDLAALDDITKAHVEDLMAEIERLKADAGVTPETPPLPDDLPDAVAKRLDDQDSVIEKERVEKERLAKELADLRDERETEKYTKMAEELAPLLGKPEDSAPILKSVGTADPDGFEKLHALIAPLVSMEKFDALLKEHGDSAATGSAVDQISAYATEIRKANADLSPAEARAQAWREHPELKDQAREEGTA